MNDTPKDLAPYFFHQGTNYYAYRYLGFHPCGRDAFSFRVWAPNAQSVALTGDFTGWNDGWPMQRVTEGGVWEILVEADKIPLGSNYKYRITSGAGQVLLKSDPYAVSFECPPATASRCVLLPEYKWKDGGWMKRRDPDKSAPMNIYELHLGSWKRHEDGSFLSYRELADELAPYVKQMGYTHVELMPVMEHPFDGSWGYQISGYYAPTARYGAPEDFMAFVDGMHQAGIGVILDWVPAHFPKDAPGLYEFDGQPLYEFQGWDRIEHAGWGTRRFDLGRNEVECFLISNAVYWAREYHADGLRVDAVASMLYLDFDRRAGEWIPNVYGDNRCLEGIAFCQKLNSAIARECPGVMTIAEESSAWKGITTFKDGGLGFTYKWNMGWMNDTLAYAETDPSERCHQHGRLTFPLMYAFNERYILPISHDEVVHGKKSFLDKMPGDYWQKFASARVFLALMMTVPGKKLHFMGSEIGQFREWDYAGQIEWFLLDYDMHAAFQRYAAELNQLYLSHSMLWEIEDSWDGFQWIDPDDASHSVLSFRRISKKGQELIVLLNFTPAACEEFAVGVPCAGVYEEIFNSDAAVYGGSGVVNTAPLRSLPEPLHACPHSLKLRLPPLGAVILRCKRKAPVKKNTPLSDKRSASPAASAPSSTLRARKNS